jgi:hypothetical protein
VRSLGFSKFRELLDSWDQYLAEEDRQNKIRSIVDSPNLVLFFVKDGTIYGAPENSRVIFARLKSKGDEDGEKWKKDADFMAINLSSLVGEDKISQSVMGKKDLKKIKVIDKEEAERRLKKEPKETKVISIVVPKE